MNRINLLRPNGFLHYQGDRTSFDGQLKNFNNNVEQLVGILGDRRNVTNYLGKCIFICGLGNNDFLNNYFLPQLYNTSKIYTLQQYIPLVINQYSAQLQVLYVDVGLSIDEFYPDIQNRS